MMHSTPPLPPFEGFQALLTVARCGSFSGAASEMGLTHGSVSRRIQHVEQWLGTQLFERHGRGVPLTPAGLPMVRPVEESFSQLARAAEPWRSPRGPDTVRISVLPSFAKLWLLPHMSKLQGAPVDLRLEILIQYELADFTNDRIDLAIRHGNGPWGSLHSQLLFSETLVVAAAPSIGDQLGADAPIDALLRFPLIHNSDSSDWRAWLGGRGVPFTARTIDYRFEDYDIALAAAEAGLGVVLLRRPFADAYLATGKLVTVSEACVANPKAHYIVTPDTSPSASTTRLIERLCLAAAPH